MITLDAVEGHPIERPLIALTDEHGPGTRRRSPIDRGSPRPARHPPCLGENDRPVGAGLLLQLDVIELRMHRERDIRDESPRRVVQTRMRRREAPWERRDGNGKASVLLPARSARSRSRSPFPASPVPTEQDPAPRTRSDPTRPGSLTRLRGSTASCRSVGSTGGSCGRASAAPSRAASPAPTRRSPHTRSST
jgi:hypothetical protein